MKLIPGGDYVVDEVLDEKQRFNLFSGLVNFSSPFAYLPLRVIKYPELDPRVQFGFIETWAELNTEQLNSLQEALPASLQIVTGDLVKSALERRIITEGTGELVQMVAFVTFAVTFGVVLITIYTVIIEDLKKYGMFRAFGISIRMILWIIVVQTTMLLIPAIILGYWLSLGFGWILRSLITVWTLPLGVVIICSLGLMVVSLFAIIQPVLLIKKKDPSDIFNT